MTIDIIGAGSLGLLIAGKLLASGSRVRLWCRSGEQCTRLREEGLAVEYEDGSDPVFIAGERIEAFPAAAFSLRYSPLPGDWLVLAVKQTALHAQVLDLLKPLGGMPLNVLCLQNGWGHMERIRELLPAASLYAAVTTEGAKRESPVRVIHAGRGQTHVGLFHGRNNAGGPYAPMLIEALRKAGFCADLSNQVETMIFRKLLINAVINPLTAIWRVPNGSLPASDSRLGLMRELYEEGTAVYDACGIRHEDRLWDDILEVCRATSGNISSMLADVQAGRETEIRWINGCLVDMARRAGVEVPANRWISRIIEGMIV